MFYQLLDISVISSVQSELLEHINMGASPSSSSPPTALFSKKDQSVMKTMVSYLQSLNITAAAQSEGDGVLLELHSRCRVRPDASVCGIHGEVVTARGARVDRI